MREIQSACVVGFLRYVRVVHGKRWISFFFWISFCFKFSLSWILFCYFLFTHARVLALFSGGSPFFFEMIICQRVLPSSSTHYYRRWYIVIHTYTHAHNDGTTKHAPISPNLTTNIYRGRGDWFDAPNFYFLKWQIFAIFYLDSRNCFFQVSFFNFIESVCVFFSTRNFQFDELMLFRVQFPRMHELKYLFFFNYYSVVWIPGAMYMYMTCTWIWTTETLGKW